MQRVKILLITLLLFSFSSCYEEFTTIEIKSDGNGTFVNNLDMSGMLEMIKSIDKGNDSAKKGAGESIDTTFSISSFIDSDSSLNEEQKQVFKNGDVKLVMNYDENVFKIITSIPFNNYDNLKLLMEGTITNKVVKAMFENFPGADKEDSAAAEKEEMPGIGNLNTIYDVTVKKGLISRKVNIERFNTLTEQQEVKELKEMAGSGLEIINSVVIKLPAPVKKFDNRLMQVSDDKQTVGLRYNLLEIFTEPSKFDYTIEY
ncbi:MAG TPA: hypothetical protein PKC72_06035 [Chitinophagaceae bacterium]|nr:hypothetical protein [Chitinophagaceae bacterium]